MEWETVEKLTNLELDAAQTDKDMLLIGTARSIIDLITPDNVNTMKNIFFDLKIASIILEKSIEMPEFGHVYSHLCAEQVTEEMKYCEGEGCVFKDTLLAIVQEEIFENRRNTEKSFKDKEADAKAEMKLNVQREKNRALDAEKQAFKVRKLGTIMIIGQLYLDGLLSVQLVTLIMNDLLKSVDTDTSDYQMRHKIDRDDVEFALILLEIIGKKVYEEADLNAGAQKLDSDVSSGQSPPTFPLDAMISKLTEAAKLSLLGNHHKNRIIDLIDLHDHGWSDQKPLKNKMWALQEIKSHRSSKEWNRRKQALPTNDHFVLQKTSSFALPVDNVLPKVQSGASVHESVLKEISQISTDITQLKMAVENIRAKIDRLEERNTELHTMITCSRT